jgi:hypothetical protein
MWSHGTVILSAIGRLAAGPRDTTKLAMWVRCNYSGTLHILLFLRTACRKFGDDDDIDGAS